MQRPILNALVPGVVRRVDLQRGNDRIGLRHIERNRLLEQRPLARAARRRAIWSAASARAITADNDRPQAVDAERHRRNSRREYMAVSVEWVVANRRPKRKRAGMSPLASVSSFDHYLAITPRFQSPLAGAGRLRRGRRLLRRREPDRQDMGLVVLSPLEDLGATSGQMPQPMQRSGSTWAFIPKLLGQTCVD